jgi:hypothetical protein
MLGGVTNPVCLTWTICADTLAGGGTDTGTLSGLAERQMRDALAGEAVDACFGGAGAERLGGLTKVGS